VIAPKRANKYPPPCRTNHPTSSHCSGRCRASPPEIRRNARLSYAARGRSQIAASRCRLSLLLPPPAILRKRFLRRYPHRIRLSERRRLSLAALVRNNSFKSTMTVVLSFPSIRWVPMDLKRLARSCRVHVRPTRSKPIAACGLHQQLMSPGPMKRPLQLSSVRCGLASHAAHARRVEIVRSSRLAALAECIVRLED